MRLTVVCPACQSQYQVDPNLRGKRMRCPNTICRTVFEIGSDEPAPEAPKPIEPKPIEPKPGPPKPIESKPATSAPKWSAPPPVRAARAATLAPAIAELDIPDDFPSDDIDPPLPAPSPSSPAASTLPAPTPKKNRRLLSIILVTCTVLAAAGGLVAQRYLARIQLVEGELAERAESEYRKGDFAESMRLFQKMQRDYPVHRERYRFLATLSELRAEVDNAHDADRLRDAREHLTEFLDSFQEMPLFKAYDGDIFETLLLLAKRSTQSLQENPEPVALLATETLWNRARSFAPAGVANDNEAFQKSFASLRATVAERERQRTTLAAVKDRLQTPTAAAIAEARSIISGAKLEGDPAIAAALKELRDAHKAAIAFDVTPAPTVPAASDSFALIPLTAPLQPPQAARGRDPVVALAPSGVFYALKPRHGELAWAERLGIDSRFPPLRFSEGDTATFITISNDRKNVALVNGLTGKSFWRHDVSAPVSAAPTLAAGRLLLPLATGRLEILDPATGKFEGAFPFDQPLADGGVVLPGTSLVALAGRADCLYIIDLAQHAVVAILETGHPAGSLLGPPIAVPDESSRSWIVLTQAESGSRIRLRPIPYPPESPTKRIEKDIVLPGTLSDPPYHDAETILLATEEGQLHQIGLRLPGNSRDPLLFPLAPATIVLEAPPRGQAMRARVVHVDAENIWVFSAGRLQRLQRSFSPQTGPQVKARWPRSLPLGEPLAVAQTHVDAEGTVLFLATHDAAGTATRLSAVDGETGKIFWQTLLGSFPRGVLSQEVRQIVWDDGGGLHQVEIDATEPLQRKFAFVPLGEPRNERSFLAPVFTGFVLFGWSPHNKHLSVANGDFARPLKASVEKVTLPDVPSGGPQFIEGGFVVPLASGVVVNWRSGGAIVTGPDWRDPNAPRDSEAHLVALGPHRFLATNGKGGLASFDWNDTWKEIARYRPADRPLSGKPFVMAVNDERIVLMPDARDELIMLDAKLRPIPRKGWTLGGKITAGPYQVGERAVMVVDGKRLIAIDPAKDGVLWNLSFLADVTVAPALINEKLIVADVQGNFWTLDPATGRNLVADDRPALSVRANIAPAASPIVLPDSRLFVFWSDGTAGIITLP